MESDLVQENPRNQTAGEMGGLAEMTLDVTRADFFQLLQQLRRIRWDAKLEVMSQTEYVTTSTIERLHQAQADKPGVYVSALAEELMVSVSMVSKQLKSLESKGWILRTIDPNSRRNTFVSMTEEGRKLLASEMMHTDAVNQRVFEKMGPDAVQRIQTDIRTLIECFEEELGSS